MKLDSREVTARAPINYFLNITTACNLSCIYCSSPGLNADAAEELTTDDYRRLATQLDELGAFNIIITGGEPLMRDDLFTILELLHPVRRCITLNTNGILITEDIALQLNKLGIRKCAVSLDSTDEQVNSRTRGPGDVSRIMTAVETLIGVGIQTSISATLTGLNNSYDQMHSLAAFGKEVGARGVSLGYVSTIGKAAADYGHFSLSEPERRQTVQQILELRHQFPALTSNLLAFGYEFTGQSNTGTGTRILPCDAAKKMCAITADGWVLPCNKMPTIRCGNVKTTDLTTIWHSDPILSVRSLALKYTYDIEECADCQHVLYCSGGCRGEAFLATGDHLRRNPVCYAYSPQ